jgi:hypothetical protein
MHPKRSDAAVLSKVLLISSETSTSSLPRANKPSSQPWLIPIHPHRPQFASFRSSQGAALFPHSALSNPDGVSPRDRKFDEPRFRVSHLCVSVLRRCLLYPTPDSIPGICICTTINQLLALLCPCIGSSRLTKLVYARHRHATDTAIHHPLLSTFLPHNTNSDGLGPTSPIYPRRSRRHPPSRLRSRHLLDCE